MKLLKLKKKYTRILLALVTVSLIAITNVIVGASNVAKLTISPLTGNLERGDTFTLTVNLADSELFNALGYRMIFDNTAFEYQSATFLDGKNTYSIKEVNASGNEVIFASMNTSQTNYEDCNGVLATVTFKVKNTALGEYNFDLVMDPNSGDDEFFKTDTNMNDIDLDLETTGTTVTVDVPATDITVSPTTLSLIKGDTSTITIAPVPSKVTTRRDATITVNPAGIVTVDNDGNVEAVGNGTATITVNAYGKTKTIPVEVTNPIQSIELNKTSLELEKSKTFQLVATVNPADTSDAKTVTWTTSDATVVSVSSNGEITAVGTGATRKATIRATSTVNANIYAECVVDVVIPITSVTMDETPFTLHRGDTRTLTFTYAPTNTTDDTTITWTSSKPSVATVNGGVVTAVGGGETTITASMLNGKWSKSAVVTVDVALQDITLNPTNIELLPGQEQQITTTFDPVDASNKTITWASLDNNIATVANGKIAAIAPGTTTINATYQTPSGPQTKAVQVKVLIPMTGVTIMPNSNITLNKGDTTTLSVDIQPANTEEDKTVTWSSDRPEIASVDAKTGVVTAQKGGTATITGTLKNNRTVTATITVNVPVSSISLNKGEISLNKGETYNGLVVTINPTDATSKTVTWTSTNPAVATVDTTGKITALSDGTTVVKATIDGKEAQVIVNVTTAVTSVAINQGTTKSMNKGDTDTLTATVLPNDATDKTITWSSDKPNVVTVDSNGNIAAVGGGTAIITAKSGAQTSQITVNVVVPITSFTFTPNNITILRGVKNARVLEPVIAPLDTTEDKTVDWVSSDPTIATVDATGKVTGVKEGTATITGTLRSHPTMQVTIDVEIQIIKLDDIKITVDQEILKGKPYIVNVEPLPIDSTEFENITFTSSDETILKVSNNGEVVGLKEGTATLTVSVGTISKDVELTIKEVALEGINILPITEALTVGDTTQIRIDVTPEDTTDAFELTYKSSDENVATVDKNGLVTAKAVGTTKITVIATTETGKEFISEMEINVVKKETLSPNTSVESSKKYLVISAVSVTLIGSLIVLKKKMKKVK